MIDVFISYSRANQAMVRQLAEAVKGEGYSVWWDDELPPHLSYGDVITEKIGAAKAAIVVWSESASASEWVRAEADVARGQKKLIQTSIDDRMPPMPFNQIQFASIGDWHGEADHPGWRKVKASLAALCGARANAPSHPVPSTPPPDPVPSPPPPPHPAQPVAGAPAPARTSNVLVPVLVALVVLAAIAAGTFIWLSGRQAGPVAAGAAGDAAAPSDAVGGQARVPAGGDGPARQGEILPNSDAVLLTEEDLEDLSKRELFLARNEVFARHGRPFRSPALRRHFAQFPWYRPRPGEIRLSAVEAANVHLIWEEEQER